MNLNVNDWVEFKVARTESQKGLFDIQNCKCNNAGNLEEGNDINYIGAKKNENGVMRKVAINTDLVSKGNGIMFICDGEGSVGYTNYMNKDFIGSTTTSIGYDKNLNFYTAMFFVSILDNEKFKYSYGRKYRNTINEIVIKLPVKRDKKNNIVIDKNSSYSEKGYTPDFGFMTKYIKSLKHKPIVTNNEKKMLPKLLLNEWEEFFVGDLFFAELSKGDIQIDDVETGNVPLISSGETNNGNIGYIDSFGDGKAKIFNENSITLDMFCNVYYQNKNFFAVSHGRVNILKPKFSLSPKIGMFINTIIKMEHYKYSYGRAVYNNETKNMIIKLPIKKDTKGNAVIDEKKEFHKKGYIPDWKFMENYIGSLPYGDRI